jgi:phosphatidylinositol glycan class N
VPLTSQQTAFIFAPGDFESAVSAAQQSVKASLDLILSLDGIDTAFVGAVVLLGAVGWMSTVTLWLCGSAVLVGAVSGSYVTGMGLTLLTWFALLAVEHSPPMYYVYVSLAVWFAGDSLYRLSHQTAAVSGATRLTPLRPDWKLILFALLSLEAMVAGFFVRSIYAVLLAVCGVAALVVWRSPSFGASLLVLSVFPLVPVDYGDATWMVIGGSLACLALAATQLPWRSALTQFHLCSLGLGMVLVVWSAVRHEARLPLHPVAQGLGWLVALTNLLALSFAHLAQTALHFGIHVFLSVATIYCLLSVAYEVAFLVCLAWALSCWVGFEREQRRALSASSSTWWPFSSHSVRSALFYLLFTYAAFFGTGNSGSLSSFEISSTYRLVTVFNPFLMGALLALKALLPFVLISTGSAPSPPSAHRILSG